MGISDPDDEKVVDVKLEPCCEIHNNPKTPVTPEACFSTSNKPEYVSHHIGSDDTHIKTYNIKQSEDQFHNATNEVHIKQELNSDSDIEVGLAYRIIDTVNVCEVNTFKQEYEKMSSDTVTSLKIGQINIEETQLKVEVDNKRDLRYEKTNNLNVCNNAKIAFIKENVEYDNINLEDDVSKRINQQWRKGK